MPTADVPQRHRLGRRPTLTNLEDLLPYASTSAAAGERRTEVEREARLIGSIALGPSERQATNCSPLSIAPASAVLGATEGRLAPEWHPVRRARSRGSPGRDVPSADGWRKPRSRLARGAT